MDNFFRMNRKNNILVGVVAFLAGVVLGFMVSPIKKGISIGNKNHNWFQSKHKEDYSDIFSEKEGITL